MTENVFESFSECYSFLVGDVLENFDYCSSPRGMKIREKLAVRFEIKNPRHRMLYVPARDFSISYMVAESLWYLLGENSTEWISNYAPFWQGISDDGLTANSAYGARMFKRHPRIDSGLQLQWDFVKDELRRDPDSRRAVIHIHTPEDSRLAKKDIPCTLALQFLVRDNKLNMIVTMRSSDLVLGIAYDCPAFTLFQELLAAQLGVGLGTYTHVSNSLHIYERDFSMCREISRHAWLDGPEMPSMPSPDGLGTALAVLDGLQWSMRVCSSSDELERVFLQIDEVLSDAYWRDWARVLLSHRAGKLKLPDLRKRFIQSTSFSGFKQFRR